jgi:hypothetical protein
MTGRKYLAAWGFGPGEVGRAWRSCSLHTKGEPDRFHGCGAVGWDELMAAAAARADILTVHRDRALVPVSAYSRSAVIGGAERDGPLDGDALAGLLGEGATVIVANVDQYMTAARACAAALSGHFAATVEAHAFRTPPGAPGIPAHADGEDNFLLQLSGRKRWQLWRPPAVDRVHYALAELGDPAAEILLEEGDALYIPRGWPHHGCAGLSGSFHVTYQILPVLVREALEDHLADRIESAIDADEQIEIPACVFGTPSLDAFVAERLTDYKSRL